MDLYAARTLEIGQDIGQRPGGNVEMDYSGSSD
jgi:hypothetical protein